MAARKAAVEAPAEEEAPQQAQAEEAPEAAAEPVAEAPEPAFYIAAADLYVGHPESGVMPARAYLKGDHVPPWHIDENGWRGLVINPDAPPAEETAPEPPAEETGDKTPGDNAPADGTADTAGEE